ncbi:ROK family glucokinase [Nocardioides sp. NBC_00368]|jgi:glucokinase|uniref:ROK family glucokinase n=1 Tax=Nocardioides TaxID=1839 RepID=UPI0002029590|nr:MULTISPECIES: ROK family glucokinase [Nocardioides]EGD40753.1 glucokinase [Nocardioidaceae bacterium Broad-1]MBG6097393.1 glucokinase [Nocardioides luteus]
MTTTKKLACGVDVGGTKILGGVVDHDGNIIEDHRVESPAKSPEAIEAAIVEVVQELKTKHPIECVGIGAAGYIDKGRSTVLFAPNIAWRDVPLKERLEKVLELPVVIENDANAAAWGEFEYGAGAEVDNMMLVTVGTGVGGGLVLEGDLYRGAFGVGAEIGHMRVVPNGHLCGCGNRGCWEQYASGSALVRNVRAAARGGSLLAREVLDRAEGDLDKIKGPLITEAARDGDAFAIEALTDLGIWLGEGIASIAAVLDPAVVAIGGGVAEADDLLLGPARRAFLAQLTGRGHRPMLDIRKATLGNEAGLIGAADLARR